MHLYRVYVVEVLPLRGHRYLYVGQTALSLDARLAQHAGGKRYCDQCTLRRYVVARSGDRIRLRRDLGKRLERQRFTERRDAERAERGLARELRGRGYRVRGGH